MIEKVVTHLEYEEAQHLKEEYLKNGAMRSYSTQTGETMLLVGGSGEIEYHVSGEALNCLLYALVLHYQCQVMDGRHALEQHGVEADLDLADGIHLLVGRRYS